jgi:hypothetical protein
MASKCANCGARLSCGCQKRTSSTGLLACSACVASLNTRLAAEQLAAKQVIEEQVTEAPVIDKTVWGANRYK